MKNLAGNIDCDRIIRSELEKAGIDIYQLSQPSTGEVPYSLVGGIGAKTLDEDSQGFMDRHGFTPSVVDSICSFTFKRAWYYWVVSGYVPPQCSH